MGVVLEPVCKGCGDYSFDESDAHGCQLRHREHDRGGLGEYYFVVRCPACRTAQGLVLQDSIRRPSLYTIWPCSWNDEPCYEDGCRFCGDWQ